MRKKKLSIIAMALILIVFLGSLMPFSIHWIVTTPIKEN
jgi:hypothetical protein